MESHGMTLLEQIAQQHTNEVVYTAISLTIEKIATETASDLLRDPVFREELRVLARQSAARAFRDLRKNGRKPRRKTAQRRR
jgi:hypothetical protein